MKPDFIIGRFRNMGAPISIPTSHRVDWKAVGYLTSIVSVFFLGAVAWLKDNPPWWYLPALIIGILTSIVGMAFRYKSHLDQQREIRKAEEEAENQSNSRPSAFGGPD